MRSRFAKHRSVPPSGGFAPGSGALVVYSRIHVAFASSEFFVWFGCEAFLKSLKGVCFSACAGGKTRRGTWKPGRDRTSAAKPRLYGGQPATCPAAHDSPAEGSKLALRHFDVATMETPSSNASEASNGGVAPEELMQPAGSNLDAATIEFLNEASATRSLRCAAENVDEDGTVRLTCSDFAQYLDLDLTLEPELAWVAREMCSAPMPPHAEMIWSRSNVIYFHDLENDYYTLEHPHTQRFLKVLEKHRLDLLAMRTKPSVNKLLLTQPDVLFHRQFRNLQIPCTDCGVMQSTVKCNECETSFCDACFDLWHKHAHGPRKNHTKTPTAVGSVCSCCPAENAKKPQVYWWLLRGLLLLHLLHYDAQEGFPR